MRTREDHTGEIACPEDMLEEFQERLNVFTMLVHAQGWNAVIQDALIGGLYYLG